MKLSILICCVVCTLLSQIAFAQGAKDPAEANALSHAKVHEDVKIPNGGNDCLAPVEKQNLKGAERKKAVADCLKRAIADEKVSQDPVVLSQRATREKYAQCHKEFNGQKGSNEWSSFMLNCLEPGLHASAQ